MANYQLRIAEKDPAALAEVVDVVNRTFALVDVVQSSAPFARYFGSRDVGVLVAAAIHPWNAIRYVGWAPQPSPTPGASFSSDGAGMPGGRVDCGHAFPCVCVGPRTRVVMADCGHLLNIETLETLMRQIMPRMGETFLSLTVPRRPNEFTGVGDFPIVRRSRYYEDWPVGGGLRPTLDWLATGCLDTAAGQISWRVREYFRDHMIYDFYATVGGVPNMLAADWHASTVPLARSMGWQQNGEVVAAAAPASTWRALVHLLPYPSKWPVVLELWRMWRAGYYQPDEVMVPVEVLMYAANQMQFVARRQGSFATLGLSLRAFMSKQGYPAEVIHRCVGVIAPAVFLNLDRDIFTTIGMRYPEFAASVDVHNKLFLDDKDQGWSWWVWLGLGFGALMAWRHRPQASLAFDTPFMPVIPEPWRPRMPRPMEVVSFVSVLWWRIPMVVNDVFRASSYAPYTDTIVAPITEEVWRKVLYRLGYPGWFVTSTFTFAHAKPSPVHFILGALCSRLSLGKAIFCHSLYNFIVAYVGLTRATRGALTARQRRAIEVGAALLVVLIAWLLWPSKRGRRPPTGPPAAGRGAGTRPPFPGETVAATHPFYRRLATNEPSPDRRVQRQPAHLTEGLTMKERVEIDASNARAVGPPGETMHTSFVLPTRPATHFQSNADTEVAALVSRVAQDIIPPAQRANQPQFLAWCRANWPITPIRSQPYADWNSHFPPNRRAQHNEALELIQTAIASGARPGTSGFDAVVAKLAKQEAFVKREGAVAKEGAVARLIQSVGLVLQVIMGPQVTMLAHDLRTNNFGLLDVTAPYHWCAGGLASAENVGLCYSRAVRRANLSANEQDMITVDEECIHAGQLNVHRPAPLGVGPIDELIEGFAAPRGHIDAFVEAEVRRLSEPFSEAEWFTMGDSVEVLVGDAERFDSTVSREFDDTLGWWYKRCGASDHFQWAHYRSYTQPGVTAHGVRYFVRPNFCSGRADTSLGGTLCVSSQVRWALGRQGIYPGPGSGVTIIGSGDDHVIVAPRGKIDVLRLQADLRSCGVSITYTVCAPAHAKLLSRRPYLVLHPEVDGEADVWNVVFGPMPGRALPKMCVAPRPLKPREAAAYTKQVLLGVRKSWSVVPVFAQMLLRIEAAAAQAAGGTRLASDLFASARENAYGLRAGHYHRAGPAEHLSCIYGAGAGALAEAIAADAEEQVDESGCLGVYDGALEMFVEADNPNAMPLNV